MKQLEINFEEWRPVVGYEGLYEVSNIGNVRGLTVKRIMKQYDRKCSSGWKYKAVHLSKNGIKKHYFVHRLVAFAFQDICGKWFENAVVNHLDRNILNNSASNLKWVSVAENNTYDNAHKRLWENRRKNGNVGKKIQQFTLDGKLIAEYQSIKEASTQTKISETQIIGCLKHRKIKSWNGKYYTMKTAGNSIWKYKEVA